MKLGILTSLALALTTAACTSTSLVTPKTFAKVDGNGYSYRATTPQGVVVAARSEDNDPKATLDFWARAADLRLKHDGYKADADKPMTTVTSALGLEGRELRYSREENGRTMRYWLTVFTTQSKVYLVEAGGDKDDFDPAQADIEKAMVSLNRK
jgi:hypothetical protein